MSKRRFSEAQIKELLSNPNIEKCSEKSISYSKEFKLLAVKKYYEAGWSPVMIFEEAGIDRQLIGLDKPNACLKCWRKIYATQGVSKLMFETRGRGIGNGKGRPRIKGVTDADKIKRLEIENAYLKAENDFLVKLRAAKKR